MFTHPTTTAALADQHRRDLLAQADAARMACAARPGRPAGSRPPRVRSLLRLAGTAAATSAAAAALLLGQAAPGAQASVTRTPQVAHVHTLASPPKYCLGSPECWQPHP